MVRDGLDVSRREDQKGLTWCHEECPRMKAVRAKQAKRKKPRGLFPEDGR